MDKILSRVIDTAYMLCQLFTSILYVVCILQIKLNHFKWLGFLQHTVIVPCHNSEQHIESHVISTSCQLKLHNM